MSVISQAVTGIGNLLFGADSSGRLFAGHLPVDQTGTPFGTNANPFNIKASQVAITYANTTTASAGASSSPIVTAGTYSSFVVLSSSGSGTSDVWLDPTGGTAAVQHGICLRAGGSVTFGTAALPMPTANITGIAESGTVVIGIAGA